MSSLEWREINLYVLYSTSKSSITVMFMLKVLISIGFDFTVYSLGF